MTSYTVGHCESPFWEAGLVDFGSFLQNVKSPVLLPSSHKITGRLGQQLIKDSYL